MTGASFLIDDSGRLWSVDSHRLRAELYGFAAGDDFSAYVVKNLGFVRIGKRGASANVWLRPATVAPAAIAQTIYWLVDERIERVLVNTYINGTWQHTVVGDVERNFPMLATCLSAASSLEQRNESVIARPVRIAELAAQSPLARAIQLWADAEGDWCRLAPQNEIASAVGHRYSLFERSGVRNFVLREFGDGMPDCAQVWLEKAIGEPLHGHPDQHYGWSCVESYGRTLDSGQPKIELVDAYVTWPGATRQRRRYARLLLPLTYRSGWKYLLSATAEDGGIDLRAAS